MPTTDLPRLEPDTSRTSAERPSTWRRVTTSSGLTPKTVALPAAALLGLLAVWQLLSSQGVFNPIIVPPPSDIFSELVDLLQEGYFWRALRFTLLATVQGFVYGCLLGFVLGALVAEFSTFRTAVYPWIVLFQNMPRVALAPLFLTWFGFGVGSKIILAVTICFVPVLVNTIVGLTSVSEDSRTLLRSLGATRWQVLRRLSLPTAAPSIMAGIKLGSTFSLLAVVIGEFLGSTEGMGVLLTTFNFQLNIGAAFAVALVLAFVGLALYGLVAAVERRFIFWRND